MQTFVAQAANVCIDRPPMETWRQAALDARAASRFGEAAQLWRGRLRAVPDDWRTALELKQDLASGYHYSESDPLFRRAARALPDEEWLRHYAALFTFHTADLRWLASHAAAMLERRPGDQLVHRVLGDVLLQGRRWRAAERHLLAAGDEPETATKLATARLYRQLGSRSDAGGPPYAVALINLDRNARRRQDIAREFRRSRAPMFRVPGVLGSALPEAAIARLGGDPAMRGTLGCFLSHVAAWEAMLARGLPHCLVIEDDVVPLLPLPPGLGGLSLPPDYDICFVNDRLQPRWPAGHVALQPGFTTAPFADAFATFAPEDNAPGADGYLLSAAGARKLLRWVREDGLGHDVDWRLVCYALTAAEAATLAPHGHAHAVLKEMKHRYRRTDRLHAHVLHPALIRTVPISSDREDENREAVGHGAGGLACGKRHA